MQEAFLETEAFQCGYCTPGMIMATIGLLRTSPNPTDQDIARLMDRNVCRCGTYPRIVAAIKLAASECDKRHAVATTPHCNRAPTQIWVARDGIRSRARTLRTARASAVSLRIAEVDRRDFLRVLTAMGGGLLVIATVPDAEAQESGRAAQNRAAPGDLASWIHIGGDGRVTAYTGKVEIGQNMRTSLSQVIADELRTPLTSVAFVMADTDLTPFDQGTFGSRTTRRWRRSWRAPPRRRVSF